MSLPKRSTEFKEKSKQMLIVVDGESEETYFNSELFDNYKRISIIPVKSGKSGACIETVEKCNDLIKSRGIDITNGDMAIIVTDVDNHKEIDIKDMLELCGSTITLHISNLCFEVWLLLHYKKITRWYEKDELNEELTKCLKRKYKKSKGINPTENMMKKAIENSKGMIKNFDNRIEECLDNHISKTTIQLLITKIEEYRGS